MEWFRPIRPYTIVWMSTLIVHVVKERASGESVLKLDGRTSMGIFLQIKKSWLTMAEKKQEAICQMLTKKVERLVAKPVSAETTRAVPNEWNNTLEDLEDDSDFQPVSNY